MAAGTTLPSWTSWRRASPETPLAGPSAGLSSRLCPAPCGTTSSGAFSWCNAPLALAETARWNGVSTACDQGTVRAWTLRR
ncbi:hypothetical protein [Nonomuraea jabiensis]|uniref:hypothetical protein n=1 Tax=Nonomuraea jabiensis TaxID=882448 RepID=UPI003D711950